MSLPASLAEAHPRIFEYTIYSFLDRIKICDGKKSSSTASFVEYYYYLLGNRTVLPYVMCKYANRNWSVVLFERVYIYICVCVWGGNGHAHMYIFWWCSVNDTVMTLMENCIVPIDNNQIIHWAGDNTQKFNIGRNVERQLIQGNWHKRNLHFRIYSLL